MKLNLRPYQVQSLAAVREEYVGGGTNRQLIVLPTAAGKSVIFREIPGVIGLKRGEQIWLLVHRNELVSQAEKHFRIANPTLKVGVERADQTADPDCDIVVASVQSVGSTGDAFKSRLRKFNPKKLKALIIDEAHHASSDIYANVLKYFRLLKNYPGNDSQALLLGVTATPNRSDKIGLEAIFDKIVFSRDIREMIKDGWLATIQAHRVETNIDLSKVKVTRGDFAIKDLEKQVNTPERNHIIIDHYRKLSEGKSGIVFSVDVAHSHAIASEFRRAGITAMPFSGQTPDAERERLLEAHRTGEIKILVSCQALGEGVDMPWAEVGLMARPTKSSLFYTQTIGRLLRPYPAPEEVSAGKPRIKDHAIIIDFVDNCVRHTVYNIPTLFGLRKDFNPEGKSITETLEEIEEAQEKFTQLKLDSFRDLAEMQAVVQAIDLLKPPDVPVEIAGMSRLTWFAGPGGSYQIVSPSTHLSVRQNQLEQYEISKHENGLRSIVRTYNTLREAISQAENMVPPHEMILVKAGAKWMEEAPSYKQIRLLSTLDHALFTRFGRDFGRFSQFIESAYTKGQVSGLINQAKTQRQQRRMG